MDLIIPAQTDNEARLMLELIKELAAGAPIIDDTDLISEAVN